MNNKSKGFTLIEVLIALSITSLIITALYITFFLSQRAIESLNESLLKFQETRSALDILKREIESSFYSKDREYSVFKLEDRDFYGRPASHVTFTSFSPLVNGLAKISYTVEEADGKLILKKSIISAFNTEGQLKEFELMEGIYSFLMEVKLGDNWVKTWDSSITYRLPDEVRISITFYENPLKEKDKSTEPIKVFETARPLIGRTL
ncbi:MAG: prepilin-type N-terminal cleavage/methylation domain-containing protein [Thermodesulfovibrionales bacterium]|nr:prepilin-type N-terminal cleavage/methylation domain-containing protein [Thermodesulfovibrionales bacterium]